MLMAELKYERFRQKNKIIHGTNTKAGRLFDLILLVLFY
jgi:voltage-gated potassium channel